MRPRVRRQLHPAFEGVRDKVAGACHYCAGAFEVRAPP